MTSDEGRTPEGAPKRFSVQRKIAIVARLLRGEPLDLVARQTNVSIARLTEWRDRALAGAATGTDMTQTITVAEGRAYVFVAVEHANSEVVGIHAARSANRFEALEPVRQGVHRCFGSIAPGVARGLMLRHDHGSNYMSGDFQEEIECLGIEASPSFVREPQGNGVASHGDVQVKGVVLG